MPYRLFALSNLASLLGLLAYPVAVEPYTSGRSQLIAWSAGYALFAVLCALLAWYSCRRQTAAALPAPAPEPDPTASPSPRQRWLWLLLPCVSSVLLVAATNYLCQDVAPVPFLWLLPLSVYLLAFIVCFESPSLYHPRVWKWLLAPAVVLMSASLLYASVAPPRGLRVQVPLFAAGLFVCCMFCHGELARRKPAARSLTSYYLAIALGGALGSAMVGLLAPLVFTGYLELPLGLAVCAALALFLGYGRSLVSDLLWAAVLVLACVVVQSTRAHYAGARWAVRNFYGTLRVAESQEGKDKTPLRTLFHGSTVHGSQFFTGPRRFEPTAYYVRQSGAGLVLGHPRKPALRVGVVGLGAGVLAAYGRPGDVYRLYEINPAVIDVAQREFTYLRDCRARVEVVLGDARRSLEREPPQRFDVLAIDAFSGDSIPVHLLSREAVELYFRHLQPDGILAVHVSNRYLDLRPVVQVAARSLGKQALTVSSESGPTAKALAAMWVLAAAPGTFADYPDLLARSVEAKQDVGLRMWTDDFSNLFQVLK